jgi:hypothetical protein
MNLDIKTRLTWIAGGTALVGVPAWVIATAWMLATSWDAMLYAVVSTPTLLALAFVWLATYQGWDDDTETEVDREETTEVSS